MYMIKVEKTLMSGKAMLLLQDGCLVSYKKNSLIVYKNEKVVQRIQLPTPGWKRIICKCRIVERALHIDARWAIELPDHKILVHYLDAIYKVNLFSGAIEVEFDKFRGHPFSVTKIEDKVFFGDYGGNNEREAVNIYVREYDKWRIAYTFPAGTIRHIHNIIVSQDKKSLYILTGDENNESGIWKSDLSFNSVEPLFIGNQQYRCCQLLSEENEYLYYITDAPSEQNYVYKVVGEKVQEICTIPGTGIYGTTMKKGMLFSTTVEPEAHGRNKLDYWFSNQPGKGITDNKTHVFYLNDGCLQEVVSYEHDRKPLRLFQYATVYFTNEVDDHGYLTPVCVKKDDYTIFRYIRVRVEHV